MLSSIPAAIWIPVAVAVSIFVNVSYIKILEIFSTNHRSQVVFIMSWILIQLFIISAWWVGVGAFNEAIIQGN